MSLLETLVIISIFISVGCREYCFFFRQKKLLPMREGFDIFSIFLWIISAFALINIFGWGYGCLCLIFEMVLLQYITHFTIGILFHFLFKSNPIPVLTIFSTTVRINLILTILLFIF